MALPIQGSEIAVGDYSPDYGTVKQVIKSGDDVTLKFKNGQEITINKDTEITIDQGGRF